MTTGTPPMAGTQGELPTAGVLPVSLIVNCFDKDAMAAAVFAERQEIIGLAGAIGFVPKKVLDVRTKKISASTYLTKGKVEDVTAAVLDTKSQLVIFNGTLSPQQQQALEKIWHVKILDRTALILEIFGKRARSKEAKLQTDLAQLAYQRGRLVRSWTHLERQRGGAGFMGGPGERQIESDKRQIAQRIKSISTRLEAVRRRRAQNRAARKKTNLPVVALVGYTNAGKSTLFNFLTNDDTQARNVLFDTLDTRMRQMSLPNGTKAILSDTVGFIADLPHDLVAAFRATLEEISEADIILHVRDFSHPESLIQKKNVEETLTTLQRGQPVIEVLNKLDVAQAVPLQTRRSSRAGSDGTADDAPLCAISARTGEGVETLHALLADAIKILYQQQSWSVSLPASQLKAQAFIYEKGQVLSQEQTADGLCYEVVLSKYHAGYLQKHFEGVGVVALDLASAV